MSRTRRPMYRRAKRPAPRRSACTAQGPQPSALSPQPSEQAAADLAASLRVLADALKERDLRAALWVLERHPESPYSKFPKRPPQGRIDVSFAPVADEDAG